MMADDPDQPYAGRLAGRAHCFAIRVYYEDTDAGGVVYHANYLRFLERARSDLLDLLGLDQAAALAAGAGHYLVAELAIRYRLAARLGEALVVVSRVERVRGSSLVIQQRVMRDRQEVASARVTVVFVNAQGRPSRQPAEWIAVFEALAGTEGDE